MPPGRMVAATRAVCHGGVTAQRVDVGTGPLAPEDVVRLARGDAGVRLTDAALEAVAASR